MATLGFKLLARGLIIVSVHIHALDCVFILVLFYAFIWVLFYAFIWILFYVFIWVLFRVLIRVLILIHGFTLIGLFVLLWICVLVCDHIVVIFLFDRLVAVHLGDGMVVPVHSGVELGILDFAFEAYLLEVAVLRYICLLGLGLPRVYAFYVGLVDVRVVETRLVFAHLPHV